MKVFFRLYSAFRISDVTQKIKFCSQLLSSAENLLNKKEGAVTVGGGVGELPAIQCW